jgi:hypothetical protein
LNQNFSRLNIALSCPSTASVLRHPLGARQLIYKCWASLLCKHLPDNLAVILLEDEWGFWHPSMYMTEEEYTEAEIPEETDPAAHNELALFLFDPDTISMHSTSLEMSRWDLRAQNASQMRTDIGTPDDSLHPPPIPRPLAGVWLDEEFDRLTKWILELRVVEGDEREKHWPPPTVKTHEHLIAHSRKKPKVGWLNIGTDPVMLRYNALGALAAYFFAELKQKTSESDPRSCFNEFFQVWTGVFEKGTFRLGVTHVQSMGVANGAECKSVVYDFDPSSMQFHCFPVAEFPPVSSKFHEGQLEL